MAQKRKRISKDFLVGVLVASTNPKKVNKIKQAEILVYYKMFSFNNVKTLSHGIHI
jgi:hypothetical protein